MTSTLEPRVITLNSTRGVQTCTTYLTPAEASRICSRLDNQFARGLVANYERYKDKLTPKQRDWMLLLAQQELDRVLMGEDEDKPVVAFPGIAKLFLDAAKTLKRPRVTLKLPDGSDVRLTLRKNGGVNVTNGAGYGSPSNRYYGLIKEDGTFEPRGDNKAVVSLLEAFNASPAKVAAEYARSTGYCSFCMRELTDLRSTKVGYGPVCAASYGLPWGKGPLTAEELASDAAIEEESYDGD